ncbi:hypothetical protein BGZ95_008167, partial [Linnemannia exigua]
TQPSRSTAAPESNSPTRTPSGPHSSDVSMALKNYSYETHTVGRSPQLTLGFAETLANAGYGDIEAQIRMRRICMEMTDDPKYRHAAQWLFRAALQGYPEGQFRVANLFRDGRGGVTLDLGVAMYWYLQAAEQGHVNAQLQVARMFMNQHVVSAYTSKAKKWFKLRRDNIEKGP